MSLRCLLCLALATVLCTLPLAAQNIALRGSLALTGCTAVDAVGATAYTAYNGTFAVVSVLNPDGPLLVGQVASGAATVSAIEAEGPLVYCAGQASGLVILNVADPAEPVVVRRYVLGSTSVAGVAVRDTLVAVATPTYVALLGMRDPANPRLLNSYGRGASWVEFQPDSMRLHVGSSTGVFSLRIVRHISSGDTTLSLSPAGTYGATSMSPLAVVGPYVDVARSAALTALEINTNTYSSAGERTTTAVVRAVTGIHSSAADKAFIALANGTVEYIQHEASTGAPVAVAAATLPATGTGLAMAQSGAQSLVVATHTNGLSVLVYDAAPVTPSPTAVLPQSLILSAYPNPFNSVVDLRMDVPRTGLYRWTVYDMLGRELQSETHLLTGTSTQRLDFAGRAAGTYIVRLSGAGSVTTAKLLFLP